MIHAIRYWLYGVSIEAAIVKAIDDFGDRCGKIPDTVILNPSDAPIVWLDPIVLLTSETQPMDSFTLISLDEYEAD